MRRVSRRWEANRSSRRELGAQGRELMSEDGRMLRERFHSKTRKRKGPDPFTLRAASRDRIEVDISFRASDFEFRVYLPSVQTYLRISPDMDASL
jgi:hypothetical protein